MYDTQDIEAVPENVGNEPESTLFNYLLERNQLFTATGFTEVEILSLHQLLQPYTVSVRQPRARPKSSWLDMLICYLTCFKLGEDYQVLGCVLNNISVMRIEDNIKCIRPHLLSALTDKWLRTPLRPIPLWETPIPHAALIIDTHTTSCF